MFTTYMPAELLLIGPFVLAAVLALVLTRSGFCALLAALLQNLLFLLAIPALLAAFPEMLPRHALILAPLISLFIVGLGLYGLRQLPAPGA